MMRFTTRCTLTAAITLLAAAPALGDAIRLHDEMGVAGEAVKLRHVAELTGERAEALGDIVVGRFEGREEIVVTLADVRRALGKREVNWGMLTMRGHRRCRVVRLEPVHDPTPPAAAADDAADVETAIASNIERAVHVEGDATLRRRVESVLAGLAGVEREKLRIDLRPHDERRLNESTWTGRFEIEPRSSSAVGRVPLAVRQYRDNRVVESFTITADVHRRAEALVATRSIARGERVGSDAVERRTVWLEDDREPLAQPERVIGQQTSTSIRAEAVLYPEHVRPPELVRRGELVTVRAMSGRLVVRTVGRASESGAMDETIQVRNEGSRETFYATVAGRREVVVMLDGTPTGASRMAQGRTVEMSLAPDDDANDGGER